MKKTLKKVLIVFLISMALIVTIGQGCALASEINEGNTTVTEDNYLDNGNWGGAILDGILGIFLALPKLIMIIIGQILRGIMAACANISGGSVDWTTFGLEDILFNRLPITRLDFFDIDGSNSVVDTIRTNVAIWYTGIRNLAAVILLLIFFYVAIRMAISTVASDEAKYKTMLRDWVVSLAILFVLHYLILLVINVNNAIISAIEPQGVNYSGAIDDLYEMAWAPTVTRGFAGAIAFLLMIGVTFIFLIMYIKRMITVAFLIIISPLITVTYSIDRMGDGRSQALNTWLKEFVYNVLIQPFHCIIYLSITSVGVQILAQQHSLTASILAIIMIIFMFSAEKIVKKIFGFESSSLGDAIGSAAILATGISAMQSKGKKAAGAAAGGGNSGKGKSGQKAPDLKAPDDNKEKADKNLDKGSDKDSDKLKDVPQTFKDDTRESDAVEKLKNTDQTFRDTEGRGGQPKPNEPKKPSLARIMAGNVAKKLPSLGKRYVRSSLSMATGLAAASLMLAAKPSAAISTYGAAKSLGAGMADKGEKTWNNHKINANQRKVAMAYNDFASKNSGLTDEQLVKRSDRIMDMDPQKLKDGSDTKEYQNYLLGMKEQFKEREGLSDADAKERVLDTIKQVQAGEIGEIAGPDWARHSLEERYGGQREAREAVGEYGQRAAGNVYRKVKGRFEK